MVNKIFRVFHQNTCAICNVVKLFVSRLVIILPMRMTGSVLSSLGDILASKAKIVSHADSADVSLQIRML